MIELIDLSTEDCSPFLELINAEGQRLIGLDDGVAVGITDDGIPAGAIVAELDDSCSATIVSLFVKEDKRRQGIGTELLYRALSLLLKKESIVRLEAEFASIAGDETGLYEFFGKMDFRFERDEKHGAYLIMLSDASEDGVLKKASSQGVVPYSKTMLQIKNRISAAHPMLYKVNIDENVSCVAGTYDNEDTCPDCLLFTKEEDTLVMVWADSSLDKLNLVRMLKFASDEALNLYGPLTKIRIPYINENSKKLIVKMMGEKAVSVESVWRVVLPVEQDQTEADETETRKTKKGNYLADVTRPDSKLFESFLPKEVFSSFIEDNTLSLIGFCSGNKACGAAVVRFMPEESELCWICVAPEKKNGIDDYEFFNKLLIQLYQRGNRSISVFMPVGENEWAEEMFKVYGITYKDSGTGIVHTTLERFLAGDLSAKKPSKNCKPLKDVTDKELAYICNAAAKAGVDYVKMPIRKEDYSDELSAVAFTDGKPAGIILVSRLEENSLAVPYLYTTTSNPTAVLELIRYATEAIKESYPPETKIDIPFVEKKIVDLVESKGNALSVVRNKRGTISLDFIERAYVGAEAEVSMSMKGYVV